MAKAPADMSEASYGIFAVYPTFPRAKFLKNQLREEA
jgi:hypothetical protein